MWLPYSGETMINYNILFEKIINIYNNNHFKTVNMPLKSL